MFIIFPTQKKKKKHLQEIHSLPSRFRIIRSNNGLLGLAVRPLGNGKMNLLAAENFGFVRILETVPDQIGANVRVGDVCHPRCSPKGHCCIRSHFSGTFFLSSLLQFLPAMATARAMLVLSLSLLSLAASAIAQSPSPAPGPAVTASPPLIPPPIAAPPTTLPPTAMPPTAASPPPSMSTPPMAAPPTVPPPMASPPSMESGPSPGPSTMPDSPPSPPGPSPGPSSEPSPASAPSPSPPSPPPPGAGFSIQHGGYKAAGVAAVLGGLAIVLV